ASVPSSPKRAEVPTPAGSSTSLGSYRLLHPVRQPAANRADASRAAHMRCFNTISSLYYRVVVIRAPLQGLCYTVRDAVDWCEAPTTRWFSKGSNHSPLYFVDQLNNVRRCMWNKATKVRCTVDAASHIYRWRDLLWRFLLVSTSQKTNTIALSSVLRGKSWQMRS